jgi:Tfp pilus assembly protein PilF
LADRATTATEKHQHYRFFLLARGLAHYRTSEFAQAVKILEKCVTPDNRAIACTGSAYLLLAMAHHRLGRADAATNALRQARQTIDVTTWPERGDLGDDWQEVVIMHLLRREAEALLAQASDKAIK